MIAQERMLVVDYTLKFTVFDTPQVVNCSKVESDSALPPVDLTGNWIVIEKLALSET